MYSGYAVIKRRKAACLFNAVYHIVWCVLLQICVFIYNVYMCCLDSAIPDSACEFIMKRGTYRMYYFV